MRSYLPEYEMLIPGSLDESVNLMSAKEGWRPIAGGTDLMVLLNAGRLPFRKLISIRHLPELRCIEIKPDRVILGAAVTYAQVRNHSVLQNEFPMLCEAAGWIGGIANQNRGTLAGNIANASPAADSAPVLLAYEAELQLTSARGARRLPYKDFHLDYKICDLASDELITGIELPRSNNNARQYARKVGPRRAQAISKVCMAAYARLDDGIVQDCRLAFGSVAPTPLRCGKTEAVLLGKALTPDLIAKAQTELRAEIAPVTDMRSTHWYRTQVSLNLLADFLQSLK